jgi:hypothetical protein
MLAFVAVGIIVLFFVLLRLGVLDQLPELLGGSPTTRSDPEEERRLEVFKDFIDSDSDSESEE